MADAYPLKLVDNGDGNGKLVQFASGDTIPRDNLPVQSSTWDTTAGALLQVGAFGANGGPARIMSSSTDANTLTTSGVCVFPDGGTNMPAYQYSYLQVITHRDSNYVRQLAYGMNNNQMFTRQRFDGTWGAWTRICTADTVVGTISNGASFETGKNEGGTYIRFADGTQVCKLISDLTITFGNSFGWGYYGVFKWTYAAGFVGNPSIAFTCKPNGGLALPCLGGDPGVDQSAAADLLPLNFSNETKLSRLGATAVGYWR